MDDKIVCRRKGQPCLKGLEMLKTHANISFEISVDPFTLDKSDVEEAVMPCMKIVDSDDESDDDILPQGSSI